MSAAIRERGWKRRGISCLIVAGVGLISGACTNDHSVVGSMQSDFTSASIKRFSAFPVYWVGPRFERWPLVAIDGPDPGGFVSFIYGTCTPSGGDEARCSLPLEIQSSPMCQNLSTVAEDPIWRRRSIRRAPVGAIDGEPVLFSLGAQIKVYQGVNDPGLALRALHAIRSANRTAPIIQAHGSIAALPRNVLSGSRPCTPA